jgi:4-hydroxybenzoate polyprenyltransferase
MELQRILRRLDAYERLIRLDKPIGALLLGWPGGAVGSPPRERYGSTWW